MQIKLNITDISNAVFTFLLFMLVTASLVGSVFVFFDIYYGKAGVSVTVILSFILTCLIMKKSFKWFDNEWILMNILFLIAYTLLLYLEISPVAELRQDPAVYMFKALNLINHGRTYMLMDNLKALIDGNLIDIASMADQYGRIQNGTKYVNGVMNTDFYGGGSFIYAIMGKIYKPMVFYGPTVIMVVNSILLFLLLSNFRKTDNISNTLFVMAFITTPLIVWFGRGPFSEPLALMFFLLLMYLITKNEYLTGCELFIFIVALTASMAVRIDYALVFIIGLFAVSLNNTKYALFALIGGIVVWYMLMYTYPTYYSRIMHNDMPVLKYAPLYALIVFIMGIVIVKAGMMKYICAVTDSKAAKCALLFYSVVMLSLYFREYISQGNYEIIFHMGKEMRSYSEAIWYALHNVFPFFISILGFLFLYKFLDRKHYSIGMIIFTLGIFMPYSGLFIDASNSPQLYWMSRRFYNILLPVLFISFAVSLSNMLPRKLLYYVSIFSFTYSALMFVFSGQIPDYEGLNTSLKEINDNLKQEKVELILYDKKNRYVVSSIIAYSGIEGFSVTQDDMKKIADKIKDKKTVFLSERKIAVPVVSNYNIIYRKLGETYKHAPKTVYNRHYKLYSYDFEQYYENSINN